MPVQRQPSGMDPQRSRGETRHGATDAGRTSFSSTHGLVDPPPCASPWQPGGFQLSASVLHRNNGDRIPKTGGPSSRVQNEQALLVGTNTAVQTVRRTFVLHRVNGEWRGYVAGSGGRYLRSVAEEDLSHNGSLSWWWIPVRKDWGYAVFQWSLDRPTNVAAVEAESPIWSAMWDIVHSSSSKQIVGTKATARPLTAREVREERALMDDPRSADSCVYLSLFHLAKRSVTRAWLLDLKQWGPCQEERIFELCRGWVIRENRAIRYSVVRKDRENNTAASDVIMKIFAPVGSDLSDAATLLIARVSPPGYTARGHAVPIDGRLTTPEFGFPPELAYCGRAPEATVEVVQKDEKRQESVDEPAPPPQRKDKGRQQKRWMRVTSDVEQAVSSIEEQLSKDIDRAFELALDRASGMPTSSNTEAVVDAIVEEAKSLQTLTQLQPDLPGLMLLDEAAKEPAAAQCIDCGLGFIPTDSPASRCSGCKKRWRKRLEEPLDKTAPATNVPDVPQNTPPAKKYSKIVQDAFDAKKVQDKLDADLREREAKAEAKGLEFENGTQTQTGVPEHEVWCQTECVERLRWVYGIPVFDGIILQQPIEVRWRSGWWRSEDQEYSCGDWAVEKIPFVGRPDMCSATLDYVEKWGTIPYYLPIVERDGLRFTTQGMVTDSAHKAQTFKSGSVIKVRGQHLIAKTVLLFIQGVEVEVLKLVKGDSGTLKSVLCGRYFIGTPRMLSYEPDCGRVDAKVMNACKWQGAVKCQKDTLVQGFAQIARANENGRKRPADPDHVMPLLERLAESYERPGDVSGPFRWGFCYGGCGRERPGKFHGRICPDCTKRNTTLGEWVAQGYEICNDLNYVRYPGVVQTKKQHPPIKKDAKTVATYGVEYGVYKRVEGEEVLVPEEEWQALPLRDSPGPRLGGVGLDGLGVFVTAPGVRPLVEAIKFRVFKDLGDRTVDTDAFVRTTHLLDTFLPLLTRQEVVKRRDGIFLDMLEWVNTMNCGRRKRALMKCLLELRRNGWVTPHDWDIIKPFVKSENLPYFKAVKDWQFGRIVRRGDFEYVPRLIQAPSDYSHLHAGPYLKPMIYGLKKDWNADNWIFYGSVEPHKLDAWLARIQDCQTFFWSDYSAFDATYSPEAWRMIETLYQRCMPEASQEFWRIMQAWRTPRGKVQLRQSGYIVKYNAKVCNCSGRDDTALANALLNGLVLGMSFAAALSGVDLLDVQPEHVAYASRMVKISVVGDDSLVGCDFDVDTIKDQVLSNIKRFGLVAKVATSDWIGDVTYLGMMPYPVGNGRRLQWGPTIGRRLYKAFWQADPVGSLPAWTRGVAQQLLLYRNVPILYDVAQRVDALLSGHKVTKQSVDRNRVWAARTAETEAQSPDSMRWLVRRYASVGLTEEMLWEDKYRIQNIERLPAVIKLNSVERMLQIDDV